MTTDLMNAQELLFGKEGLRASNFKMYPGTARDIPASEVSAAIGASLNRLVAGELEELSVES